ncbi:hypothetical protein [Paraburkholderia sp. BCC1876]|uniref:hypothetical protein n=1 Tax=Paraburkholderia sp. BCC1876 TaxID=2676303 RepID=UPI0015901FB2|nr:hypothetical protein [Paraburkholderia sp. BCC1876]
MKILLIDIVRDLADIATYTPPYSGDGSLLNPSDELATVLGLAGRLHTRVTALLDLVNSAPGEALTGWTDAHRQFFREWLRKTFPNEASAATLALGDAWIDGLRVGASVGLITCHSAAAAADRHEEPGGPLPVEFAGVAEVINSGSGQWRTCAGCHESADGHPVGDYVYSERFQCDLGSGCGDCGGIGAVWDNTDYAAMGDQNSNGSKRVDPVAIPAKSVPAAVERAAFESSWVRDVPAVYRADALRLLGQSLRDDGKYGLKGARDAWECFQAALAAFRTESMHVDDWDTDRLDAAIQDFANVVIVAQRPDQRSMRQDLNEARHRIHDIAKSMRAAPLTREVATATPEDSDCDTNSLVRAIVTLLEMDAAGALVPHGVGGPARKLLASAAARLAAIQPHNPGPRQPGRLIAQAQSSHHAAPPKVAADAGPLPGTEAHARNQRSDTQS